MENLRIHVGAKSFSRGMASLEYVLVLRVCIVRMQRRSGISRALCLERCLPVVEHGVVGVNA